MLCRLVVQDRKALRCCEFGQHRWLAGLCLFQECDSPSQASPMGICEQTGCGYSCRACFCTSRGGMVVGISLSSPGCCMYTRLPQKPMAVWFHPGARALPSAALGVGVLRRWCPPRGGLCPTGFLSPQVTVHLSWHTRQAAGAHGPAELLLSPAAWPGPPTPLSDHGCLSPSRVPAGPSPHPLERAT